VTETDRPIVSYLGWHGRGNIGDDAIYDAVTSQLVGARFVDLPRLPHERILSFATGLDRSLRQSVQVLGGGTLVGRRTWRRWVNRGSALTRNNGNYAIGVGVEDPDFGGRNSGSSNDELKHWGPMLSEFRTVSVRGPRSAELLADIGVDVSVSGDPALVLPTPEVTPEDGLIGVNLGFGDDLWGHDPERLTREMSSAVRQLARDGGHRFVGILMNPDDRRWTAAALEGIDADIVAPADAAEAAKELARCTVAVTSRLHAGILAALSATPVVSLEYQPKCRDFALSIDDERSLIRTDELTSAQVVDRVRDTLVDASNIRATKAAEVARLRERLQAEYGSVAGHLGLEAVQG
jgi:polysaccharide pyruvyl transferase WcaK-like protein